jgi:hypothetical protein
MPAEQARLLSWAQCLPMLNAIAANSLWIHNEEANQKGAFSSG